MVMIYQDQVVWTIRWRPFVRLAHAVNWLMDLPARVRAWTARIVAAVAEPVERARDWWQSQLRMERDLVSLQAELAAVRRELELTRQAYADLQARLLDLEAQVQQIPFAA